MCAGGSQDHSAGLVTHRGLQELGRQSNSWLRFITVKGEKAKLAKGKGAQGQVQRKPGASSLWMACGGAALSCLHPFCQGDRIPEIS